MNKGFSLLEVLVVITILLTVLGGGMISYSRFNTQRALAKDVDSFIDVLTISRQKTIDRDLDEMTNCTTFTGYRVRVSPSTATYEVYRRCEGLTIPVIETHRLTNSRIDAANMFDIDFEYPYGILSGVAQSVTFKNDKQNECERVRITEAGIISLESCT